MAEAVEEEHESEKLEEELLGSILVLAVGGWISLQRLRALLAMLETLVVTQSSQGWPYLESRLAAASVSMGGSEGVQRAVLPVASKGGRPG